jgi:Uncharacterized conserved protein
MCIGKTDDSYLAALIEKFERRLGHYVPFKTVIVPDIRNSKHLRADEQKSREAAAVMKQLATTDHVILLDEKGKVFRSMEFAEYLNTLMIRSTQHIVFVVGGPYGFDDTLYQRANGKVSLSKMTFSHQMVRLFFVEQLYRAFTILKGEPYHHE